MTTLKSLAFNNKAFYVVVFGIFFAILMRNSALYPSIFADEYNYSSASRLLPLSQAPIANYLYLLIYRTTNFCGDGFLSCARILNATFFILACPFIYQTAKRVCSKPIARYIAILSLVGPINIYTANFMPEAMYFFVFWVFAWFTLGLDDRSNFKSWFGVGVLIGLCMLVKPHGVFLLLPITLYLIVVFSGQEFFPTSKFLCAVGSVICGALLTKFILGFLIAGENGLSILGNLYSTTTSQFASSATNLSAVERLNEITNKDALAPEVSSFPYSKWAAGFSALISFWLINLRGHIISVIFLYGFPLLVIIQSLGIRVENNKEISLHKRYAWFTFFVITSLILFSSLFSGFVSLSYGGEILRIHMRYYNFCFPLLLILLPAVFSSATEKYFSKKLSRIFLGLGYLILAVFIWATWKKLAPYQPTAIDTPELRGATQFIWIFYLIAGLTFLSLILWPVYRSKSAKLFLWLTVPLLLIGGSLAVSQNIWERSNPDNYDRAGIAIKQLLTKKELSQLVVVGDNFIELSRVLFYLDDLEISSQVIAGDATYESRMLPKGKSLVLLLDKHQMASDIKNQIHFNGFTLGGGSGEIKVDFHGQNSKLSELNQASGLFLPPESWGTWSIGKEVSLVFMQALPEQFTLTLDARAFGPNIGKPISLQLGDNVQTFTLTDQFQKKVLAVKNPQRVNALKFIVPKPTSPKELQMGEDDRKLGIALKQLEIDW